jgi:hypothetical protein
MSIHAALSGLAGGWTGTHYLWLRPDEEPTASVSMAEIGTAAGGNFLTVAYEWAEDGPQDGLILLNQQAAEGDPNSVWLDSFHTAPGLMLMRSSMGEDGIAVLDGSYAAPPGPDWGWRIVIDPTPTPNFHLLMFNITPGGDLFKAVEVVYTRIAPVA